MSEFEIRTDPEAIAAYRHALGASGLFSAEKLAEMDDSDVLETVAQMIGVITRAFAPAARMIEAMRVAINDLGGRLAPMAETLAPVLVDRRMGGPSG